MALKSALCVGKFGDDCIFPSNEIPLIAQTLCAKDLSLETVVAGFGLAPGRRIDVGSRMPLTQLLQMHRFASEFLSHDELASVASSERIADYGVAGMTLLSAPTMRDALAFIEEFSPLLSLKLTLNFHEDGSTAKLTFPTYPSISGKLHQHILAYDMAKLINFLTSMAGSDSSVLAMTFDHAMAMQTGLLAKWRSRFRVHTGDVASLEIDRVLLDRPLILSDKRVFLANVRECERLVGYLDQQPKLVRRVKQAIIEASDLTASEAQIAQRLGMSERTFRRRLHALGTTYNKTVAQVRFALAKQCLFDPALTVCDVAERVGYTEAANFRHAFKRWANCSPQAFRRSIEICNWA